MSETNCLLLGMVMDMLEGSMGAGIRNGIGANVIGVFSLMYQLSWVDCSIDASQVHYRKEAAYGCC